MRCFLPVRSFLSKPLTNRKYPSQRQEPIARRDETGKRKTQSLLASRTLLLQSPHPPPPTRNNPPTSRSARGNGFQPAPLSCFSTFKTKLKAPIAVKFKRQATPASSPSRSLRVSNESTPNADCHAEHYFRTCTSHDEPTPNQNLTAHIDRPLMARNLFRVSKRYSSP